MVEAIVGVDGAGLVDIAAGDGGGGASAGAAESAAGALSAGRAAGIDADADCAAAGPAFIETASATAHIAATLRKSIICSIFGCVPMA